MAWNRYAWGTKANQDPLAVPLKPAIDPQHLAPTANPEFETQTPLWIQSGLPAPAMPDDTLGQPFATPIRAGGGPIDHTPDDPSFGTGVGHGQTTEEAQEVRTDWMELDYGSVAARRWQTTTDREPGTGPTLAIIPATPSDGDSPDTLKYGRTGVGEESDHGNSRISRRQKRSWARPWDRHMFGVELRPRYERNAYTAQPQPPVPGGTQIDSPYATAATDYFGPPNRFLLPQTRRQPRPWDAPDNIHERAANQASDASEALMPSWGL